MKKNKAIGLAEGPPEPTSLVPLTEFERDVYAFTDSLSEARWDWFGTLGFCRPQEDADAKLAGSVSQMRRKVGTSKFRVFKITEIPDPTKFYFHIFIGGVRQQRDFAGSWTQRWFSSCPV